MILIYACLIERAQNHARARTSGARLVRATRKWALFWHFFTRVCPDRRHFFLSNLWGPWSLETCLGELNDHFHNSWCNLKMHMKESLTIWKIQILRFWSSNGAPQTEIRDLSRWARKCVWLQMDVKFVLFELRMWHTHQMKAENSNFTNLSMARA